MVQNIILIDHEPFTIRRKELFYINEIIASGFNVEVWNVTQWFYPQMTIVDTINEKYVKKIVSKNVFISNLETCNINESVFIVESFWNWHTRELFRALSDYNCLTIKMDMYANSTLIEPINRKIRKLFSHLMIGIVKRQVGRFLLFIYNKRFKIKDYKYYFSSSSIVNRTHAINHPDYEKYRFSKKTAIISGRYAVFCDIYFPNHPDIKNFNRYTKEIDENVYQRKLRFFFDYFENKYGMSVVIAAHPKANYRGNEFGNRRIIKYQTDNLVQYASCVLMHQCNTISYAILNKKPIILFTTDEYEAIPECKEMLENIADFLKLKTYNIDKVKFLSIQGRVVDDIVAEEYIYTYLTSNETQDKKNIETIISFISKL